MHLVQGSQVFQCPIYLIINISVLQIGKNVEIPENRICGFYITIDGILVKDGH